MTATHHQSETRATRAPSVMQTRRSRVRPALLAAWTVLLAFSAVLVVAAPTEAAGTFRTTGTVTLRTGPSTSSASLGTVPAGTSFTLACQSQNGTRVNGNATWDKVVLASGASGYVADYWTTTPSFNSFAPGTGDCSSAPAAPAAAPVTAQMQAAAAWAIAEKNSPNPRWSDHYGHAWSGWCEQFAEQAEGFAFRFGSAAAAYQWQQSNGRIHTDGNPPVGALVYYGGAGGYGHVAVSIGGGQAVGTLGGVGDNLPVSQYPVKGYLTNSYLGWANPIGS